MLKRPRRSAAATASEPTTIPTPGATSAVTDTGAGRESTEDQPASRRGVHPPRRFAAKLGAIGHGHRTDDPSLDHQRFTQIENPASRGPLHSPQPRPDGPQIDGEGPILPAPGQELPPIVGEIDGSTLGLSSNNLDELERQGRIERFARRRKEAVESHRRPTSSVAVASISRQWPSRPDTSRCSSSVVSIGAITPARARTTPSHAHRSLPRGRARTTSRTTTAARSPNPGSQSGHGAQIASAASASHHERVEDRSVVPSVTLTSICRRAAARNRSRSRDSVQRQGQRQQQ